MVFSPAYTCYPRGTGCSPVTPHNTRNTKMDLHRLLLGLAAVFLSMRRLYSRQTKFPDPEGNGGGHWSFLPTSFLLWHSMLLITSCNLLTPTLGSWETSCKVLRLYQGPLKTAMGDP